MQDILFYMFQFADNDLKNILLRVNKQLNRLKYNDFINDDISKHILKHKGYLNITLYNQLKNNIEFIQQYDKNFNIGFQVLDIFQEPLIDYIDLTGLVNLQTIYLTGLTGLQYIDLTGLVNFRTLFLTFGGLTYLDLTGCVNLQDITLSHSKLKTINLNGLTNLKYLDISTNQLQSINLTSLVNLEYLDISAN